MASDAIGFIGFTPRSQIRMRPRAGVFAWGTVSIFLKGGLALIAGLPRTCLNGAVTFEPLLEQVLSSCGSNRDSQLPENERVFKY